MKDRSKNILALLLITLGLIAMALGIYRGEAADVLRKATMVCMECIGLG